MVVTNRLQRCHTFFGTSWCHGVYQFLVNMLVDLNRVHNTLALKTHDQCQLDWFIQPFVVLFRKIGPTKQRFGSVPMIQIINIQTQIFGTSCFFFKEDINNIWLDSTKLIKVGFIR